MEQKKQKQPKFKPPRLLKGLLSFILLVTSAILVSAWAIINYQVEKLVAQRTSEYARSITQIAANSAAEALLSEDKIHLQMLVTNVAKDPYIRSATVFAEDGQIVAEKQSLLEKNLDELTTSLPTTTTDDNEASENQLNQSLPPMESNNAITTSETTTETSISSIDTDTYLATQQDIPFVEKIVYQGVTAGWFKITLNRQLLESDFRESLIRSQKIILGIAIVLLIVLMLIIRKYYLRINQLVNANHRLIKLNADHLPRNSTQWLEAVQEISETRLQELNEHLMPAHREDSWHSSRREEQTVFCYCQFAMADQENELTASTLTLAENYLQSALQSYGLQSQGDILSGCLIPLYDSQDKLESLNEAISLVHLIKKLLAELTLPIKLRAFIGIGSLLVLENERGAVTGISLSNRMIDKLGKLAPQTQFEHLYTLGFDEELLQHFAESLPIDDSDYSLNTPCFELSGVKESIIQRINRQVSYILSQQPPIEENNSIE